MNITSEQFATALTNASLSEPLKQQILEVLSFLKEDQIFSIYEALRENDKEVEKIWLELEQDQNRLMEQMDIEMSQEIEKQSV